MDGYASGWELIIGIRRFHHRMEVALDQSLEEFGVSFGQHRMLEVMSDGREIHLSDLARRLGVTRQTAQGVADQLLRGDLARSAREGRVKYLALTDGGRLRLERRLRPAVGDVAGMIEDAVAASDRRRIILLLSTAEAAMRAPHRPTWWLERPHAGVEPNP